MNQQKIQKIQQLNAEIENFKACYNDLDVKLWGDVEDAVNPDKLLAFLIENPHFQQIADNVKKLDV